MTGWSAALELAKDWNFVLPGGLWAGREGKRYFSKRRVRNRLWGIPVKDVVTLVSGVDQRFDERLAGEVGSLQEARALQSIASELRLLGYKTEEMDESVALATRPDGHLVFVGHHSPHDDRKSPIRTKVGSVCTSLDRGLRIGDNDYDAVLEAVGGGRIQARTDFGVLVRFPSPFSPSHSVLAVTGRFPSGVAIAASALTRERRSFKKLLRMNRLEFAVIKGDPQAGAATSVEIESREQTKFQEKATRYANRIRSSKPSEGTRPDS